MARSMRLARDMYIVLLLHLAWALMAVPVVTRQQRVPASAATWLALILLLPVAGTLLYILAGYRRNGPTADCPACRDDRLVNRLYDLVGRFRREENDFRECNRFFGDKRRDRGREEFAGY